MLKRILTVLCIALLALPVFAQSDDDVRIDYPPPSFVVSGVVDVYGDISVDRALFRSYLLEVTTQTGDDAQWTPVTLNQRALRTDGILGIWDTTRLPDGVYRLRTTVFLTDGTIVSAEVDSITVQNAGAAPAPAASTQAPAVQPTDTPPPPPTVVPRPVVENLLPLPVGGQLESFDDDAVELMRAAGMTWIKWQIPFVINDTNLINVARDRINYSHANGFFAMLSVKGSKDDLATLGGDAYFPLYAAFLGDISALQPDAIQVWNEMNLDREWPNGQIDPALYVDLLTQSYNAIKAVDPTIRVISGAPAPTGAEGAFGLDAVWNDDRYYQGMANAGAAQVSDCIGIHYNEGILPPTSLGGDPRGEYPTYYLPYMIRRADYPFTLNGGTGVPLCFSELGYLSPEGYGELPGGFAWGANTSVAEQAQWLRDAIQYAATQTDADVQLLIVFNVNYTRFVDGDPQGGFAIIRPDGSCPACEAIGELRAS
jgi:hypothetical protein